MSITIHITLVEPVVDVWKLCSSDEEPYATKDMREE